MKEGNGGKGREIEGQRERITERCKRVQGREEIRRQRKKKSCKK